MIYLDPVNQSITRNDTQVQLSAKAFTILNYLFERPNQLVSKIELLNKAWADTVTVEAVLKNCISELRKALDDDPKRPEFIQTIHRRGYRFIGKDLLLRSPDCTGNQPNYFNLNDLSPPQILVGRDEQFLQLTQFWQESSKGVHLQVVLNGEPGVGKSILANSWIRQLEKSTRDVLIIKSQCKSYTKDYSYMTLIDCIDQICNSRFSEKADQLLERCCPQLVSNLPILAQHWSGNKSNNADFTNSEILLFQIARFFECLSKEISLLWLIDDVHWSDSTTITALNYIKSRNIASKFMVLMTCCDWDIQKAKKHYDLPYLELTADSNARVIAVPFLDKTGTISLIKNSLKYQSNSAGFENRLYKVSGGHPLITLGLIESFIDGQSEMCGVPKLIQQRMQIEVNKLDKQYYCLLQAASIVVIKEFSAAAIAWMTNKTIIEVEDKFEELALSTGWIKRSGVRTWPDGTMAQLYSFTHRVYRDYIYQTLSAGFRRELHVKHAKRLEMAYEYQTNVIAANLTYHYQQGCSVEDIARIKMQAKNNKSISKLSPTFNLEPKYHQFFAAKNLVERQSNLLFAVS